VRGAAIAGVVGVVVAVALTIGGPAARANPADMFGFGGRGPGMANAATAAADDATANYYNPAILATFREIRLELGYQVARPTLRVDGEDLHVDDARGSALALSVPGRIGPLRLAFGGGLFLPDRHVIRTRTLPAQAPRFALYDNRPQRYFLAANLAVAAGDRLFLGAGISYMSSTQGSVHLTGRIDVVDPDASELDLGIDVDLKTIRYPQAGLLWRATPWLDLGLTYRGGFHLEIDQAFALEGDVGAADDPVVDDGYFRLRSLSQDLFQPAQLTAGLAARLTHRLALAFDLCWQRWSAFENPAAKIDIDLDIGIFNDQVDLQPTGPLAAPHYHDIAVPRLGLEWLAVAGPSGRRLTLRGGYAYEPTPAPEQIGETNFIDSDKQTVTLGAGWQLPHLGAIVPLPVSFDGYLAVTRLAERTHAKLSPVDAVGDYRASGHVWQAGLSSRWRF
jgi:long-subunit fatty acid transport protein